MLLLYCCCAAAEVSLVQAVAATAAVLLPQRLMEYRAISFTNTATNIKKMCKSLKIPKFETISCISFLVLF